MKIIKLGSNFVEDKQNVPWSARRYARRSGTSKDAVIYEACRSNQWRSPKMS